MKKSIFFKIKEISNQQFFEAIHEYPLFQAHYDCISDRVTYFGRATNWEKFMVIWRQIGLNYCIIRNLNKKLGKSRGKHRLRFRRNLAIYRLYRYQNIPIKLLMEISSLSRGSIKRIVGEIFKVLCISDEKCVFKTYLEEKS